MINHAESKKKRSVYKSDDRKKQECQLNIKEKRYGVEPEITAKLARLNAVIYEVGISYQGRTYEQGKKIGWKDGISAIWCIFRYNCFK